MHESSFDDFVNILILNAKNLAKAASSTVREYAQLQYDLTYVVKLAPSRLRLGFL